MKNIKIGLLPLYIKLYDDSGADRSIHEAFNKTLLDAIKSQGIDAITTDICRIKPEFEAAIESFEKEGCDAIVTIHHAYSPSLESIDALAKTKLPIIVFDTTVDYSLSDLCSQKPVSNNHGIHGVMDMCNLLKRRGKKYAVVAGHMQNSAVLKNTCDCIRASVAALSLAGSKVGRFGTSFDGMGDFIIEKDVLKNTFGVDLVQVADAEMVDAVSSITDEQVAKEFEIYKEKFVMGEGCDLSNEFVVKSIKACLATRKIIAQKGFDAFSVNFLDVKKDGLGSMPFVETCLQMQNGVGYAGEGDILTASFVGAFLKAFKDMSFIEIFCPDWKEDRLLISHMGEMNYEVACTKPIYFQTGFKYTDAKKCCKATAAFKEGKAVYCNLFRVEDEKFKMSVSPVEMEYVQGQALDKVRGWLRHEKGIAKFLEELSENGAIHHGFMIYDVDVKAIKFFANLIGLDVVEI